jgi:hypothetical protein
MTTMTMTTGPSAGEDTRDSREVEEAAERAFACLVDLRVEQKAHAVAIIEILLAREEATWSEEARTGRWQ